VSKLRFDCKTGDRERSLLARWLQM